MQKTLPRKQGVLPELSRTLHLESGIVGKCRLPRRNDRLGFSARYFLAFYPPRRIFQVKIFSAKFFSKSIFDREVQKTFNSKLLTLNYPTVFSLSNS